LPALLVTMLLCAPDTQGPWSAHSIMHLVLQGVKHKRM
jgi:hypothetical protein